MDENEWLADRFEEQRTHLRAVAYRMLGSLTEADDAVQDAWLRVSRAGTSEVENLGGWLTTIVARVCLNMLRSRNRRREEPFGVHLPDPVVSPDAELQPEEEALLADSVGLALLVVLDTLTPAERLAFVLHDMFELPFDEIAPMVGRTPVAAGSSPAGPDAASRAPRSRRRTPISPVSGRSSTPSSGRRARATSTLSSRCSIRTSCCGPTSARRRPRRLGGDPRRGGRRRPGTRLPGRAGPARAGERSRRSGHHRARTGPFAVMGFTVVEGRIVEIDAIADPERVRRVAASVLDREPENADRP